MEFKIIRMNEVERRIGLSVAAIGNDEERNRLQQYSREAAAATQGIGEMIGSSGDDSN